MNIKTFEIRDRATLIAVMAVKLVARDVKEAYLLHRAGYFGGHIYILITMLAKPFFTECDPYEWEERGSPRTMREAHLYIEKHFDLLTNGEVIDVEFILGEKLEPSKPEMEEYKK